MQITDVEISVPEYCPEQARHRASVCLTLADRIVTLFCSIELTAESGAEARRAAFLGDALRQMKRMPEFRAGRATLEIAEGLTPHPGFA